MYAAVMCCSDLLQTTGLRSAMSHHDSSLESGEFIVEAIIGHRYVSGKRQYAIRYRGYDSIDDTYEPLYNLNCSDLLREYWDRTGINPNDGKEYKNRRSKHCRKGDNCNSVHSGTLMRAIRTYSMYLKVDRNGLEVAQFPGSDALPDRDMIYVHLYNGHWYVILLLPSIDSYYVADGANSVLKPAILGKLRRDVSRPLRPKRFLQQSGIDHCGASAVAITLTWMRQYKRKQYDSENIIITFKAVYKRIVKQLHKAPSATMRGSVSIQDQPVMRSHECPHCHMIKRISFQRMSAHINRCRRVRQS